MSEQLNEIANRAGVSFFDYQVQALTAAAAQPGPSQRRCLYYKTGAGKSLTALSMISLWGHDEAVVIAPPSTHLSWEQLGSMLGVKVSAMSHAKFRMKDTRLSRTVPVVADEMHMFGGHKGQGWKKLEKLSQHLQAPLVMASATPNYNDAERVYCIQRILDPRSTFGGYLEFLYRHCNTRQNPFGMEPLVDEDEPFRNHTDAADYLSSLPNVDYLADDLVYKINDVEYLTPLPDAFDEFGYNEREHRIIASQIEERHTRTFQQLVDEHGLMYDHVFEILADLIGSASTPVLVYCNHATVAEALAESLRAASVSHGLVTGKTPKVAKDRLIAAFKDGSYDVLVGTASLATGTDGLDKMCDWLIILDDTDDDALRRQLIGRIMPRGADADASKKQVYRLVHPL